jgi:hypothetical protein
MNQTRAPFSRNQAFEKALTLLAHPVSIAALGLLLVNDHLLRRLWPSWWTGKIGDLAWLFFIPFALAALLAWILPARMRSHEGWVFGLSFAAVGLVFGALKTIPGLNLLAARAAADFFHTPIQLTRDPSDLLTLPALLLSVLFWRSMRAPARVSPRGWVLLPLAALLTLANSGVPDPGIVCFNITNGLITAGTGFATYQSDDGGFTWNLDKVGSGFSCERHYLPEGKEWNEIPALQPNSAYRYRPGDSIYHSTDGEQTWQVVYDLSQISEARQVYYIKSRQGYAVYQAGPLDAMSDAASGNTLFAMGHQGVLLLSESGDWKWVPIANYRRLDPFPTLDAFSLLLGGMLYLAAGLAFLIYDTLALRWAAGPLRPVLVGLGWLAWLLVGIFFPPAQATGYGMVASSVGVIAIFVLSLPLCIEQSFRLFQRARLAMLPMAGYGLLAGVLYLLPYLLWIFSTLPQLWWATLFSLLIAAAVLVAGFLRTQPPARARRPRR